MGVLVLDDATKGEAERVRRHAEKRENWYVPGSTTVPGDDSRHVFMAGTYRVVFSWTLGGDGRVFRHLSISVGPPYSGKAPSPIVVFTIAHWLGFTGAEPDEHGTVGTFSDTWQMSVDRQHNAAIVAEPVLHS